jgi:hypothetical protein
MSDLTVEVIEYKRPYGEPVPQYVTLAWTDNRAEKLSLINQVGLNFSVENLGNGLANVCLEHRSLGFDYDTRIG